MGGCRQTFNIWWYLFTRWPNYGGTGSRWRGWELLTKRFWRFVDWGYLWHDSFSKFWFRAIRCGHDPKVVDSCDHGGDIVYCFKCERELEH